MFPSKTETQGISLLEGLATGRPAVCIRSMGVIDVLKNEQGGFLTEDDPDAYCACILELLRNQALYEKKALQARKRADELSVKNTTGQLLEVYANVIQANKEKTPKRTKIRSGAGLFSRFSSAKDAANEKQRS